MSFGGVEQFPMNAVLPADCTKIYLLVQVGGDGIRCDHANLGEARIDEMIAPNVG